MAVPDRVSRFGKMEIAGVQRLAQDIEDDGNAFLHDTSPNLSTDTSWCSLDSISQDISRDADHYLVRYHLHLLSHHQVWTYPLLLWSANSTRFILTWKTTRRFRACHSPHCVISHYHHLGKCTVKEI